MSDSSSKPTLPSKPRRDEDDARWCAWATRALDCDEAPIVGARAYGSDDVEETAIVIQFADKEELLFRPARMIVSRRLLDVFAARGCDVPNYTAQQIRVIGSALGRLARNGREDVERARSELEFATLGAEWLERCRLRQPAIVLAGRDGHNVRAVIDRVTAQVATGEEGATPALIHDVGADEILVLTSPFRQYVRVRRGTTADDLLGVQMQRVGWRRGRLAARPVPPRTSTVDRAMWIVPNGWQGINVETPLQTGDYANFSDGRSSAKSGS